MVNMSDKAKKIYQILHDKIFDSVAELDDDDYLEVLENLETDIQSYAQAKREEIGQVI